MPKSKVRRSETEVNLARSMGLLTEGAPSLEHTSKDLDRDVMGSDSFLAEDVFFGGGDRTKYRPRRRHQRKHMKGLAAVDFADRDEHGAPLRGAALRQSRLASEILPGPGSYFADVLVDGSTLSDRGVARISEAHVPGVVDAAVARSKGLPAPGAYDIKSSTDPANIGGGRFNLSKAKTDTEWAIYYKRGEPGPGHLGLPAMPSEAVSGGTFSESDAFGAQVRAMRRAADLPGPGHNYNPLDSEVGGGRFSLAKPKTYLELAEELGRRQPGPGSYAQHAGIDMISGGRFNESNSKTALEWEVKRATAIPGPGHYTPMDPAAEPTGGKFASNDAPSQLDLIQAEAALVPGPGAHSGDLLAALAISGGRFNHAYVPSAIDAAVRLRRDLPGPGTYELPSMPLPITGKWSSSDMRLANERQAARQSDNPGPGAYRVPHTLAARSARIGVGRAALEMALPSVPGPGAYEPKVLEEAGYSVKRRGKTVFINSGHVAAPPSFDHMPYVRAALEAPDRPSSGAPGPGWYDAKRPGTQDAVVRKGVTVYRNSGRLDDQGRALGGQQASTSNPNHGYPLPSGQAMQRRRKRRPRPRDGPAVPAPSPIGLKRRPVLEPVGMSKSASEPVMRSILIDTGRATTPYELPETVLQSLPEQIARKSRASRNARKKRRERPGAEVGAAPTPDGEAAVPVPFWAHELSAQDLARGHTAERERAVRFASAEFFGAEGDGGGRGRGQAEYGAARRGGGGGGGGGPIRLMTSELRGSLYGLDS